MSKFRCKGSSFVVGLSVAFSVVNAAESSFAWAMESAKDNEAELKHLKEFTKRLDSDGNKCFTFMERFGLNLKKIQLNFR